jgi:uncharacterized protein (DUF305 family)
VPTATEPRADTASSPRPRPWWHSLGKVALACAATFVLGAGVAMAANRTSAPGLHSVDVRFLQDMRWHHDQAVDMGLVQFRKHGGNLTVTQIAREIVQSQQLESGSMVEQLHTLGAAEANEIGTAMEWMGMAPTPVDEMPGMATPDQLTALAQAEGRDADILFLRLMIVHHAGGIHMADYAAEHAKTPRIRDLALAMSKNQASEITELTQLQASIGGA